MQLQSINSDMRLYCIAGGTCCGFDVLNRKARAVASWMIAEQSHAAGVDARDSMADWPEPGTVGHFVRCNAIMTAGGDFARRTGKRCPAELVPALIGLEGKRVECEHYGERVRFYVGKSTGWMPGHLMIKTRRSTGGEMLSADSVRNVRVIA